MGFFRAPVLPGMEEEQWRWDVEYFVVCLWEHTKLTHSQQETISSASSYVIQQILNIVVSK